MKKVGFAVLGCGNISRSHFKGILETDEAELVAVCDLNKTIAEERGQEYGVPAYTNFSDMLQQDNISVICICTPSGLHPEQTIQAAAAGKNIITEKPMALNVRDALKMVQACKRHQVKLTTILPRRFSPAAQFAKRLINEGRLGKLSLCSGYVKFYRSQEYYDSAGWRGTWEMDGGGSMMNQGIHTVDLLQWLAGKVASLHGLTRNVLRDIEVEDTSVTSLYFRNGALGSLETTTTAYNQPSHQIVIHGEKGTLILTGDEITTLDLINENIPIHQFPAFRANPDGHIAQIRDMALAVMNDREPMVTGADGLHALEIITGTYESSSKNKMINFNA